MEKQIAVREISLLLDIEKFEHAQRVAKMLSTSTMVPDHFRDNIGNCVIALNYAARVGIDPFMCMQKMYLIHGKPAIEAQLQIALFNRSNEFSNLQYKLSGNGDSRQCTAFAITAKTGEEIEGPAVSIDMAKKEGWFGKKGSKWQTMPELMLRYRAAAFFIRLNAPETTLGISTMEEAIDIGDGPKDITPEQQIIEHANHGDIIDIEVDEEPQKKIDEEPQCVEYDVPTQDEGLQF